MNKELFSALSDIESELFALSDISNALCVYHGGIENELDVIMKLSRRDSSDTRDRFDTVLSVLTLAQIALTKSRATLEDAHRRAHEAAIALKTE